MYTNGAKGLITTPIAAILPQTGHAVSTVFTIAISVLLIILAISLIAVEIKKHMS